jgi:hypothetical protein
MAVERLLIARKDGVKVPASCPARPNCLWGVVPLPVGVCPVTAGLFASTAEINVIRLMRCASSALQDLSSMARLTAARQSEEQAELRLSDRIRAMVLPALACDTRII